jgi:hypothetical protein
MIGRDILFMQKPLTSDRPSYENKEIKIEGEDAVVSAHSEEIPMEARIMAVADVFDALSSPRVYKPAFPLEKALSIIQEGSGTQFDPKCVEVFMDNLTEVKVILKKYNQDV